MNEVIWKNDQQGTYTDSRDNLQYKVVKIGNQIWLAENLAFKPSNGNYWAYDDNQSNVSKYGYLYDFETAKKVSPDGWHLPSDKEWITLSNYLGGTDVAGGKMKAATDWGFTKGYEKTDESGFCALPAGYRFCYDINIMYCNLGKDANFWSNTLSPKGAWYRSIDSDDGILRCPQNNGLSGFSIRCIKNEDDYIEVAIHDNQKEDTNKDKKAKQIKNSKSKENNNKLEKDLTKGIDLLSEDLFLACKNQLIEQLESYSNLKNFFAQQEFIIKIQSIIEKIPSDKLKRNMGEQLIDDFKIYPIWEAGKLAIDSYVPWPDVDYMSHSDSVLMSKLLLQIASHSLLTLNKY